MTEFTNLGNFLKQKRIETNLTQRELATALGNMNSQFVSNWERGLLGTWLMCASFSLLSKADRYVKD
jgi:hypothetical protein